MKNIVQKQISVVQTSVARTEEVMHYMNSLEDVVEL